MADLYNSTGTLGIILDAVTNNVTGSLFLTLLLIVTMFIVILFVLRVPFQFQPVLLLPFLIYLMAFTGEFLAIGGIALILLGVWAAIAVSASR